MRRLRVTPDAQQDVDDVLYHSEARFGPAVADRYRLLIAAALQALCADPERLGVRSEADLAPDLRLYPLRNSRRSVPAGQRIGSPRHLVVFRTEPDALVVVRLLDERMNLPERLGETR